MSSALRQHLPQGLLPEASPSPLASRAADALRRGDFKEAIELFRRLVKQDGRPEWRTALADAYAGRARILAAKGMFEEAEVALSKTAGPDGTVRDPLLYVKCLFKLGRTQKAAELAVRYLENDQVPTASASQLAELAAALWLIAPAPQAFPAAQAFPADRQSEKAKWVECAAAAQRCFQTPLGFVRDCQAAHQMPAGDPERLAYHAWSLVHGIGKLANAGQFLWRSRAEVLRFCAFSMGGA